MNPEAAAPPDHVVAAVLKAALEEDLGEVGDITSRSVAPRENLLSARVVTREAGVVAGLRMSLTSFEMVDPTVKSVQLVADGTAVERGAALASVKGPARAVLAAERTCLNVLGHLSGIATATRGLVDLVAHTTATIVDTRKTTPGLRALEKYAVRAGGGHNHRFGLFDAVLIKDNHLGPAGGVGRAVVEAKARVGHMVKVEVEVEDLGGLQAAIEAGADAVLLDNMGPADLEAAVELAAGRIVLEASGGITPATVAAVAESGVDLISMGWITHSAPRLDVALDVDDD